MGLSEKFLRFIAIYSGANRPLFTDSFTQAFLSYLVSSNLINFQYPTLNLQWSFC